MLLRLAHHRRNPRCRPLHHSGRRRIFGADHLRRLPAYADHAHHFRQMTNTAASVAPSALAGRPGEPILDFRNVSISFTGPPVLENVSFSVGPNETRILLGPAGVGKSVLL